MNEQNKNAPSNESLLPPSLADILEDLIASFPSGCFCLPSQQTITKIKDALDSLLIWITSALISNSLKLELQAAINAVRNQLDANPFSCCDTIKAFGVLELVLSKVVTVLSLGTLLNLLQQLGAIFDGYIACLACEPEPNEPTATNATIVSTGSVGVVNDNTAIPLANNTVINGADIIHSPGSTDITLAPNHTYYVYYSIAGLDMRTTSFGTQLFLDGIGVVGSVSFSVSATEDPQQFTNTQAVIINTGTTSSILQLRNISGSPRAAGLVTITIIELI
ncbi:MULTISPECIES: hypothetical protein [Bacillus cereus group]|uniref:hypothetical protein n=1 Tax=Bacillus TaxID=1386 RepID=UPI0001A1D43E|nr:MULTISPECIES: hypothetical protein [Bacillus cereus group]EEM68548.1 CL2 [Bacillus thuringiensis serovar andalousiensis BGSC 4AW1]MEB9631525.1 hypothetical protein [Bacillus anthracis]OUB04177.1 hypothetical protein BK714_00695 [Bacillus thuringiensis serovar oswaldocruzi]